MELRQAEIEDLPVMAKVGRYFHDISDYGKIMSYDEIGIQDNLLRLIEGEQMLLWNAWEDGKLVGMVAGGIVGNFYDPTELIGQCLFLAVIPEAQQKKVSRALRDVFEKWATENGASLFLYSGYSEKFLKAMKREGFEQVEYTVMKKALDAISV